jgi:hypothetical protein
LEQDPRAEVIVLNEIEAMNPDAISKKLIEELAMEEMYINLLMCTFEETKRGIEVDCDPAAFLKYFNKNGKNKK